MFDEQFPEDDEHAECRHEIHRLSAEIESLKSRLPVNADGDVVLWGDDIFYYSHKSSSVVTETALGLTEDGLFVITGCDCSQGEAYFMTVSLTACHSTADSCRAAHGGGK